MFQKTSRKNVTSTVLIFSSFLSFCWTSRAVKNQLKRTALKYKKKKHMPVGKELEAR